jgi:3-oxoacyl-[acyl-carrier protein] reductase
MPRYDLTGKVALVTGAASGIGKATAIRLAKEGANLALGDLKDLSELCDSLKNYGVKVVALKLDVSDYSSCESFYKSALSELCVERADILVNNAGINRDSLFVKMSFEQWDDVIKVDLYSMFNMTKQVVPKMLENSWGRIVNVSSISWLGNIGQANYSAAKAGVIGFTKTLARELAKHGITVNAVCPGFIDTPMTRAVPEKIREMILSRIPMKRIGNPEEVASVIAFLCSDDASYITGEVIGVTGGLVL